MASTKCAEPQPSAESRRWEVEDAVRTLTRAEAIKRDARLMKDVRVLAADVKRIAGRDPPKATPARRKK